MSELDVLSKQNRRRAHIADTYIRAQLVNTMWAWLATLATAIGTVIVAYIFARCLKLTSATIDREISDVTIVVVTQVTAWSSQPVVWVASTSLSLARLTIPDPTSAVPMYRYWHGRCIPLRTSKTCTVVDRFWRCSIGKALKSFTYRYGDCLRRVCTNH